MPIDKEAIQQEARLMVIEHMLQKLWVGTLLNYPDPQAATDALAENYRTMLSQETFGGDDPALSDLAAAEVQEAFDRFLTALKETLAEHQKKS